MDVARARFAPGGMGGPEAAGGPVRVGIAYYGAGNIGALTRALERVGAQVTLVRRPEDMEAMDAMVLPGVGAMASAVEALEASGLADALRAWAAQGAPLLGVCLGMQMLVGASEEGGRGLDLLPGRTARLASRRVPNLGWCRVTPTPGAALFATWPGPSYAYFAHSYAVTDVASEALAAVGEADPGPDGAGVPFVAALAAGHVWGVQFHPERSGPAGQAVLAAFVDRVRAPAVRP